MVNDIIGKNIKSLRESAGYTQKNLADFLRIDQSLVSKIENGERNISTDMLENLTALFGVKLTDIIKSDVAPKPLSCAFRCSDLTSEEMDAISYINRIALNSEFMESLLEGVKHD